MVLWFRFLAMGEHHLEINLWWETLAVNLYILVFLLGCYTILAIKIGGYWLMSPCTFPCKVPTYFCSRKSSTHVFCREIHEDCLTAKSAFDLTSSPQIGDFSRISQAEVNLPCGCVHNERTLHSTEFCFCEREKYFIPTYFIGNLNSLYWRKSIRFLSKSMNLHLCLNGVACTLDLEDQNDVGTFESVKNRLPPPEFHPA